MSRLIALFGCLMLFVTPALATSEFSKEWKNEYLGEGADEGFVVVGRKAGCYVCHVKDHPDKKKARNEYGKAVHEFLKKDKFTKEYIKANPEKAREEMLEGFKKAGEKKSEDGRTFAEKLKNNELPATDAGL